MTRRALCLFALVASCVATIACKRAPQPTDAGAPAAAVPQPLAAQGTQPAEPAAGDPVVPPPELPAVEAPRDPYLLEVGVEYVPGAPAPTAPKADPFADAIAGVRSSAVGCFASLPPGEYAATVSVFVTPAGSASTVSVTSGPSDDAVRKCLVQAATRSYPPSPDGRKLSIDVSVKG